MIQPSMPKIIHGEAFDKVCEVLNKVHHVKHTDWDLHVPAVVWAYRAMCKTLTVQAFPKLKYETEDVVPVEHAKLTLRIIVPVDMTVRTDWKSNHITTLTYKT